jgi:Yip1 domain
MDTREVLAWLRRILYLDFHVFEEVRTNPTATIPGVVVATLSTFIAGLGGWLWWVVKDFGDQKDILINSALLGSLLAVVLWAFVWLGLVYVMLTQVFRERAFMEQLLRVMGLAASPLALMLLMFIPGVSLAIGIASLALTFGLTTIAVKTVTTADQAQVLAANTVGFFVWAATLTLLASSSNPSSVHAPGVFLYSSLAATYEDILDLSH